MYKQEEIFVVTTNAGNGNDSRPRNNKSVEGEKREKRIFTTDNRNSDKSKGDFRRSNVEGRGNGEYKPRTNNGEYKPKTNSGEFKPKANNGEFKPRTNNGEYKPRMNNNNAFNNRGYDKDKDEETPVRRSKPKVDNKPKEQQSDKTQIINRIEKEKKAMRKKHTESRGDSRPAKHTARPKRSGNIDWTREYENDSYDDDDLDMYL